MEKIPSETYSASALRSNLIEKIKEGTVASDYMDLNINNHSYTKGITFFPYGNGTLLHDHDLIPIGGIMIVGQDFGNLEYVENKAFIEKGEKEKPTMRNFLNLLEGKNEDFFFTNLFIGLRKDKSMIGKNPALKSNKEQHYTDFCYNFFEYQVLKVMPRLIVVLGKVPFEFLCKKQDSTALVFKTFTTYFANPFKHLFNEVPMICLPHPSMWNSNLKENKEKMEIFFKENIGD